MEITVIYDGLCEFCERSLTWIQKRVKVSVLPYQSSDVAAFNLTKEQCSQQVYVIAEGATFGGADAIAYLLRHRGNKASAAVITWSGPVGRAGYRWVASHRHTWPVRLASRILARLNK